ncbi:MAG: NADH-quinone oxidoreductase subunit J [Gemmatimonadetes bacterium]|nr:NADH-quinone oxidoreductase subunit J [Gemmatimonadota bacterium]
MQPNLFHPLAYTFTFYFFGLTALASAVAFVTRKSPVAAAMWLVNVMFCLAGLYVMLDAQFIGAIQVLVYTGAIMVVFLFVIMLLNLGHVSDLLDARGKWGQLIGLFLGLGLLAEVMALNRHNTIERMIPPDLAAKAAEAASRSAAGGVIGPIAAPLFKEYLLAFELTSILLLAAIVGAVVLGKRRTNAR